MAFKNVPAPQGSKSNTPYQRFIPREELGDFASWQPGTFGNAGNGGSAKDQDNAATRAGFANSAAQPLSPHAAAAAAATAASASTTTTTTATSATSAPGAAPELSADEWHARIAAARQSGLQSGHQAGYQEGYRDGLVALENFKQSFAQQTTSQVGALLKAFEDQLNALDSQMAGALAHTAVQLARQVLRVELQTRPDIVAKVAAEAVGAVMLSARHIVVQVHPLDLPLVVTGAAEVLQARGARLQANADIQRGGVLVQSDVGSVDAGISTRWAQAAAALGAELPLEDAAA
jgi:flagellar assembly protein FliH